MTVSDHETKVLAAIPANRTVTKFSDPNGDTYITVEPGDTYGLEIVLLASGFIRVFLTRDGASAHLGFFSPSGDPVARLLELVEPYL